MFPDIGAISIRDVTAAMVFSVLRKVEARNALRLGHAGRASLSGKYFVTPWQPARPTVTRNVALRGALPRPRR